MTGKDKRLAAAMDGAPGLAGGTDDADNLCGSGQCESAQLKNEDEQVNLPRGV
jgi:hypothetical protein